MSSKTTNYTKKIFLRYLGDVHLGEFLNPGYNCTDILNHEKDATDGFYWITLGTGTKRKVSTPI